MKNNTSKKTRVVVAMSGGVDSSVAAALLKEQGYDVIGVSLKLWDYDEKERQLKGKTCCSLDDIADAKDVCDTLGIPFYAFNHKPEFQKQVIDRFVSEYVAGRTPNPCVFCNQYIKFDVLLDEAQKMGADYLATGHYARIQRDEFGQHHLHKGKDNAKDQSYVLFHLSKDDLNRVLFPIGDYTKSEIRALAKKYNLVTHDKKESMEICFIPSNDHAAFIEKNYKDLKHPKGNFVDPEGRVLGQHKGIDAYTVGQRRGLGTSFGLDRSYVTEIRPETNEVVLSPDESDLDFYRVKGGRFHFLRQPLDAKKVGVKIRYQRDEIPAQIVSYDDKTSEIILDFYDKARAVTAGQALVVYENDEVIGGGWIIEGSRAKEKENQKS